jgi:hypothetical protein
LSRFARLGIEINVWSWRKDAAVGKLENFRSLCKWVLFVAGVAATVDFIFRKLWV